MSNLNNSWMSCRTPHKTTHNLSLLPQFAVPPGVTDFAVENRPPHLPDRNSPSRACLLTVAAVLCIVGSYNMINAAAEPVMTSTSKLARGVSSAVGRAISQANEEAQRNAQRHYDARQLYLNKRRLSGPDAAAEALPIVQAVAVRPRKQSALLLRMAALLKTDSPGTTIDFDALDSFFPRWREQAEGWNHDEVLRDLILAVSQLAHSASVDTEPVNR